MRTLAAAFMLLPSAAFASALPPSVILTLPTEHYILGAALTVGLTALLGVKSSKLPTMQAHLIAEGRVWKPLSKPSYISFLCLFALVLIGFYGSRNSMHNLMTLVFWTGIWIALPLACLIIGNFWHAINPRTAQVRIARILLRRTGSIGFARFRQWPLWWPIQFWVYGLCPQREVLENNGFFICVPTIYNSNCAPRTR